MSVINCNCFVTESESMSVSMFPLHYRYEEGLVSIMYYSCFDTERDSMSALLLRLQLNHLSQTVVVGIIDYY